MYNTEIGKFCAEHENWRELLIEEPYCLKIKEDGRYVMFCYDQIRSDFNISMVRECRGIIFRTDNWQWPVCWAFNKFGNYGESYVPEIDWQTSYVTEKIDGSLIKVWWDGSWHISTNGTIDAAKAETGHINVPNFREYFEMALKRYVLIHTYRDVWTEFTSSLSEAHTYMFELVGPYNRVVVPYDVPMIYFLGARNNETGEEFNSNAPIAGALGVGRFNRPTCYSLTSLDACLKAAELKDWDDEGFVVVDAQHNRVKIKSPAYVMAHYARNNNTVNRKHLIKIIKQNEVEEFLCYASDYEEALRETQKLMNAYYNLGNQYAQICRKLILLPRKQYAEVVRTFPKVFQDLLFKNYDRFVSAQEYTNDWSEVKWDEYLVEVEALLNSFTE